MSLLDTIFGGGKPIVSQSRKRGIYEAGKIPGAQEISQQRTGAMEQLRGAQAPQYGGFSAAPNEQLFQQQADLASQMQDIAAGRTLSPAEMQFRNAMAANIAAQQSAAASAAPGLSSALAQRTAQRMGAQLGGQLASEGAVLRAQEQQRAQQNLANLLAQQQSGRLGLQELTQRGELENLRQAAQLQRLQEELTNRYIQQGFDQASAEQMAAMDAQKTLAGIDMNQFNADTARINAFLNALGAAGQTAASIYTAGAA